MPQAKLWTEEDFQELLVNASKPYISGITLLGGDPFHPVNREQLLKDAEKNYISGITLIGGDPFHPVNRGEILDLCKRFKDHFGDSKTIWIYTGYTWETLEKAKDTRWECLKYIDVLCDGPYIDSLRSPEKPWVGSENQRVINVPESLKKEKIILL